MEPRIRLEDFSEHCSLSDLKCSRTGQRAAFTTSTCELSADCYKKELWLYDHGAITKAVIPEGFAFYEWETGNTLLIGWQTSGATVFRRLHTQDNRLEEAAELPFTAKAALPLADGRLAVIVTADKNAGEDGIHKAFEIFEELPLRQNAEGYTSGLRRELFLYCPESGKKTLVAGAPYDVEQMRLTPDGRNLVYSGRAYQDMRFLDHSIWRYDLERNEYQEVLSQKQKMFLGYFACDEAGVTYSATDCLQHGFGQVKNLYRFDFAEGTQHLLHQCQRNVGLSEVIADGRRGALSQFCLHGKTLYLGSTYGYENHVFRLTEDHTPEKVLHMDGSVDAMDVAGDGTVLVIAHKGQRLQELYRVEQGAAVRVSGFNEAFYQRAAPVKPEHFTFFNDGVELDGWVLLPDGFDSDRRYPAILDIHGGPRLVYGEIYFHEMQAWCARGYVVMYCNPRGGGGRGNEFSNLWSPRTLGQWDYSDAMAFVDEVLARYPNVDAKRLGVTGGSYGGFLTNWIIGQTGKPRNRLKRLQELTSWFDRYLGMETSDWKR